MRNPDLESLRTAIDEVDDELFDLFVKRLGFVKEIAYLKAHQNIPLTDPVREEEILERQCERYPEYRKQIHQLVSTILMISHTLQQYDKNSTK